MKKVREGLRKEEEEGIKEEGGWERWSVRIGG